MPSVKPHITFVTDQRQGEPDILGGFENEALIIADENMLILQRIPAPSGGWTHDALMAHSCVENGVDGGVYDAFFEGFVWIGGTEV